MHKAITINKNPNNRIQQIQKAGEVFANSRYLDRLFVPLNSGHYRVEESSAYLAGWKSLFGGKQAIIAIKEGRQKTISEICPMSRADPRFPAYNESEINHNNAYDLFGSFERPSLFALLK